MEPVLRHVMLPSAGMVCGCYWPGDTHTMGQESLNILLVFHSACEVASAGRAGSQNSNYDDDFQGLMRGKKGKTDKPRPSE